MKFVSWIIAAFLFETSVQAAAPTHPLDSLTTDEYESVRNILEEAGRLKNTTRFAQVSLLPAAKDVVKAWVKGDPIPRMAVAYLKDGVDTFKVEVDLVDATIKSFVSSEGGEPMFLLEEILAVTDLVLGSPEMLSGLSARGVAPEDVYCAPLSAGTFGDPDDVGRRLMKVPCSLKPTGSNWHAQPIEGLLAFVDLNTKEVLEVTDSGIVPIPQDPWGFTTAELLERFGELRGDSGKDAAPPVETSSSALQVSTGTYTVDDSIIEWDIWRFHVRVDKRPGVILSQIEVNDQGTWRSVMYEAHLSEVFVPYMDPDQNWYFRTYMDSGEYGFGVLMSPLQRGVDCPKDATYMSVTMPDDFGLPFDIPDSICVFERSLGNPAWRHFEFNDFGLEGRAASEFVVRYASSIGNYDYLVDYVFMQDGGLKAAVGSTGLDACKGVETTSMNDATAAQDTQFGSLIAENLLAVYHSHFFNFRFDFDIDGESNNYKKAKLVPLDTAQLDTPRKSMWGVEFETVESEVGARTKINPMSPSNYYFVNENVESGLGHKPGYQLLPSGSYSYSLLSLEDIPVARNPYVENQIYVTKYDPTQIYAGGEYPVQSGGNETIQTWTDEDRSIQNEDIVAWYTMGFHHVPRMEDYPVMPTKWATVEFQPFNFFSYNPAISLAQKVDSEPAMVTTESSVGGWQWVVSTMVSIAFAVVLF